MKILIQRRWETAKSICGELSVDEQFESFTLERPRIGDHPAIPVGVYKVILTPSPHLGYITLLNSSTSPEDHLSVSTSLTNPLNS